MLAVSLVMKAQPCNFTGKVGVLLTPVGMQLMIWLCKFQFNNWLWMHGLLVIRRDPSKLGSTLQHVTLIGNLSDLHELQPELEPILEDQEFMTVPRYPTLT